MFFSLKFSLLNQFNGVQWRQHHSNFMIDLNVTPGYIYVIYRAGGPSASGRTQDQGHSFFPYGPT